MEYDTFIEYFRSTDTALFRDYKHNVVKLVADKRDYTYEIDNPKS